MPLPLSQNYLHERKNSDIEYEEKFNVEKTFGDVTEMNKYNHH